MKINKKLIDDYILTLKPGVKSTETKHSILKHFKGVLFEYEALNEKFNKLYKEKKETTKNTYKKYLNNFIDYVNRKNEINVIKLKEVKISILQTNKIDPLTYEEYIKLINNANYKYKVIMQIQYILCLRAIELKQITYEDIRNKKTIEILNKGKYRTVVIPGQAKALMDQYIYRTGTILTYTYQAYNDYLKKISQDIIGKKITTHSLRSLRATRLDDLGISLKTIQEILGHESLATTSVYLKNTYKKMKDALEML